MLDRWAGALLIAVTVFGLRAITLAWADAQTSTVAAAVVERINYYRRLMNLPQVSADQASSANDQSEAQSALASPDASGGPIALRVVKGPGYLENGAGNPVSVLLMAASSANDGAAIVDRIMALPLTALKLIDPQLVKVGTGISCDQHLCAVVLSVKRGLAKQDRLDLYEASESDRFWNPRLGPIPPQRGKLKTPLEFPPDGTATPLLASSGVDFPELPASCGDYRSQAGPPIILELGAGASKDAELVIGPTSLTHDGSPVEFCLLDSSSYGSGEDGNLGKKELSAFGAVIIVPRKPLQTSGIYSVSIVADSTPYTWTFKANARR